MTLTEINYYTRRFMPVLVILFLVFLIFFFGFKLLFLYVSNQNPIPATAPEAPAVAPAATFGQIPPPSIAGARDPKNYSLILDTLDGTANVEHATSAAQVYFIRQKTASFGFLSKIYLMAKAAGFDTDATSHRLEDKTALFDDNKRKLSIDIRTFNFHFDYTITADDNVSVPSQLPTDVGLSSQAATFLSTIDRYPTALAQGNRNVIYMSLNPDTKQITTLPSADGANMAEVDFFPADIDGLPVVTSTYYNSPQFVMYLLGGEKVQPVRANITYFERSEDESGIYSLRTPQQAWDDLLKGEGYVVSAAAEGGEVKIKKVFWGYYESEVYQKYVQPVYVFLGEQQFAAYVPAVSKEFLSE